MPLTRNELKYLRASSSLIQGAIMELEHLNTAENGTVIREFVRLRIAALDAEWHAIYRHLGREGGS